MDPHIGTQTNHPWKCAYGMGQNKDTSNIGIEHDLLGILGLKARLILEPWAELGFIAYP